MMCFTINFYRLVPLLAVMMIHNGDEMITSHRGHWQLQMAIHCAVTKRGLVGCSVCRPVVSEMCVCVWVCVCTRVCVYTGCCVYTGVVCTRVCVYTGV